MIEFRKPYFKASQTSLKLSKPASTFSTISRARTSGAVRSSREARLESFIQVMSRLV
jgi:hypothetical protein